MIKMATTDFNNKKKREAEYNWNHCQNMTEDQRTVNRESNR